MKLCALILMLTLTACGGALPTSKPKQVKEFCYEGVTYIWVGGGYGGASVKMDRNGNVIRCY